MSIQPCAHVAAFLAQQVMLAATQHRPFAQAMFYMGYRMEIARATPLETAR